jgi:tripartite-type tricarboxylate transporter receptor subunit TctC
VPYKGASELVNAVLGKQVVFGTPILSVPFGQIQAGKLRALAVAGTTRNPMVPDVPTLAELGVPVEVTSWGGVSVPAGTPDAVVARIGAAFEKALQQPEVVKALQEQGGRVNLLGADAFVRGFTREMEVTEAMMKRVGLTPM